MGGLKKAPGLQLGLKDKTYSTAANSPTHSRDNSMAVANSPPEGGAQSPLSNGSATDPSSQESPVNATSPFDEPDKVLSSPSATSKGIRNAQPDVPGAIYSDH